MPRAAWAARRPRPCCRVSRQAPPLHWQRPAARMRRPACGGRPAPQRHAPPQDPCHRETQAAAASPARRGSRSEPAWWGAGRRGRALGAPHKRTPAHRAHGEARSAGAATARRPPSRPSPPVYVWTRSLGFAQEQLLDLLVADLEGGAHPVPDPVSAHVLGARPLGRRVRIVGHGSTGGSILAPGAPSCRCLGQRRGEAREARPALFRRC